MSWDELFKKTIKHIVEILIPHVHISTTQQKHTNVSLSKNLVNIEIRLKQNTTNHNTLHVTIPA